MALPRRSTDTDSETRTDCGDRNVAAPLAKDAVAALRALGFSEETSSKMVADVLAKDAGIDSVEKVIKAALASR